MEEVTVEIFQRKKRKVTKTKGHGRNCCRNLSEKGKEKRIAKRLLQEVKNDINFIFSISLRD